MALYRCGNCGHVAEDHSAAPGAKAPCGRCGHTVTWFAAVFYFQKLVERYLAALREIDALKRTDEVAVAEATAPPAQDTLPTPTLDFEGGIHNTTVLATREQHEPLASWFASKQVQASFDYAQVDTSGFFDEAAKILGDHHALLGEALDQIRYGYRRGFTWVEIDLSKKPAQDAQRVNDLFRELYSHTFFARYGYQKQTRKLGLTLQPAPGIRRFFDGGWLEWYVFVTVLQHCVDNGLAFSCARGVKLDLANGGRRELDVVFLAGGNPPLVVECKSGEFRADIDKHVNTRRALGVDRDRYLVCSADLPSGQASGLTAMYELSFVNLETLKSALPGLLPRR